MDQVAIYKANILSWTKQMHELQNKIEEAQQKKVEIKTSRLASVEEKLVQKTKIGIQHDKVVCVLDGEIQKLKNQTHLE